MHKYLFKKFLFGIVCPVDNSGVPFKPPKRVLQVNLMFGPGALIPLCSYLDALILWQEAQKIILSLHAEKVHIKPSFELMPHIAKHVKIDDQQIVDAFKSG